jgi:Zn-dependent protease with chaperone function
MSWSARRTAVAALVVLAVLTIGPAAARADVTPQPGSVSIGDKLGRRDVVTFYFPGGTERAVELVRNAAVAAGLPVRAVLVDDSADDALLHVRLGTTLGRRTGLFAREIPARTLQALDVFHRGHVLLVLHPGAQVGGGAPSVHEDVFARKFDVPTSSDATYRVPLSWLVRILAVLLVVVALPLAVMAAWATRIERGPGDDVDKVHRLRVAMTVAFSAFPLVSGLLVVIGGLFLVPDMILSEVAPPVTDSRVTVLLSPLVAITVGLLLTDVAAYLGVHPADRRLRGTDDGAATAGGRFARALIVSFLPLIAWFAFVLLAGESGSATRLGGLVVFMLLLTVLGPVLVLRAQETYRLDEPLRSRLLAQCESYGLQVRDLRAIRGRSARVANAMITGVLPRFRYVLITDHLLDNFSEDELEAVVAHEIGHGRQHHLLIKTGSWLVLVVAITVGGALPDPAGAVVGVLAIPALIGLFVVQGRLGIALEERADDYAVAHVGVEPVVRALEKLADLNMTKRRTGAFWNALQQHPGMDRRIGRLQARVGR